MNNNINVTVFTSTYNRGYILGKLYETLKRQTYNYFEWIIIDDGSIDNTENLVNKWIKDEKLFNIIYKKTINKGKHCAINLGVKLAKGKLFFIVDSDDYLSDNAIERIVYWQKTINKYNSFAGVCGNRCYFNKKLIGKTFTGKYVDCKNTDREKFGIIGDKAEAYYTEILKKYPFPEFENEKFCSEGLVWNRIANDGYKIRFFNENIYFTEYRDDGLTKNILKNYKENPKGTLLFYKEITINKKNDIKRFLKYGSFYYLYGVFQGYKLKELQAILEINKIQSFLLYGVSLIRKYIKRQL